jgi:hypothetical protein
MTGCLKDTSTPRTGESCNEGVVLTVHPTTNRNTEGEVSGVRVADLSNNSMETLQGGREDVFCNPGGLLEVSDQQGGRKGDLPTLEETSTPRKNNDMTGGDSNRGTYTWSKREGQKRAVVGVSQRGERD